MAVFYCLGIPVASWFVLRPNKNLIKKLQTIDEMVEYLESEALKVKGEPALVLAMNANENNTAHRILESIKEHTKSDAFRALLNEAAVHVDEQCSSDVDSLTTLKNVIFEDNPMLTGLSPLYKDYNSEHWYFQIPNFIVTVGLCGVVTLIGSGGVSQVFLSLFISNAYSLLLANSHPYSSKTDNFLAQFCQASITFALTVSVLEQAETSSQDSIYGPLLIICTVVNLGTGVLYVSADFLKEAFPDQFEILYRFFARWLRWKNRLLGTVCDFFARWCLRLIRCLTSHGNAVAPVDPSLSGMPPSEGNMGLDINGAILENSERMTIQAGDVEEQRMPSSFEMNRSAAPVFADNEEGSRPVETTHSTLSDAARKISHSLLPIESSDREANRKPKVQKLPSLNRNIESLTVAEILRSTNSAAM
jgi:hypothetical protein